MSVGKRLRQTVFLLLGGLTGTIFFILTKGDEKYFPCIKVNASDDHRPFRKRPRILCYINTFPGNYENKALHVHYTWARRCSDYVFTSTKQHDIIPVMGLNLSYPETRNYLWIKMKAILREIYKHINNFDYFLKADDDTYVIMENLERMLEKFKSSYPFMTGYRWLSEIEGGFFSGGAGYLSSKEAIKRVVELALDKNPNCTDTHENKEDVEMSSCVKSVGAQLVDSFGSNGDSLFHPYTVTNHLRSVQYNLSGMNRKHISYHYMKKMDNYLMEFLLYHLNPAPK